MKEKKSKKEKIEKEPKMKKEKVQVVSSNPADFREIHEEIGKIENAYINAINGQIKFGEVKSMFKKLHKEIKKTKKQA